MIKNDPKNYFKITLKLPVAKFLVKDFFDNFRLKFFP